MRIDSRAPARGAQHGSAQELVDAHLMAFPSRLEPHQNIRVESDGERLFNQAMKYSDNGGAPVAHLPMFRILASSEIKVRLQRELDAGTQKYYPEESNYGRDAELFSDCLYDRRCAGDHAALTVSFKPMALVTATSVDRRGFPRSNKARYRLSRSMPAALATLAMPCAIAR